MDKCDVVHLVHGLRTIRSAHKWQKIALIRVYTPRGVDLRLSSVVYMLYAPRGEGAHTQKFVLYHTKTT